MQVSLAHIVHGFELLLFFGCDIRGSPALEFLVAGVGALGRGVFQVLRLLLDVRTVKTLHAIDMHVTRMT